MYLKNYWGYLSTSSVSCLQIVLILSDNTEIELKEMTGHFTLEVTGVCAFGISTDALKDENAEFYKVR